MTEKEIEEKLEQVRQKSEDWIHQQAVQQLRDISDQTEDGEDISVR